MSEPSDDIHELATAMAESVTGWPREAISQLTALRAELAQARAEQQRVETALAEALRQLWQAKEELRETSHE